MTTPSDFVTRWSAFLPPVLVASFLAEFGALLAQERARERRRLATDRRLYDEACRDTATEIERYNVATRRS